MNFARLGSLALSSSLLVVLGTTQGCSSSDDTSRDASPGTVTGVHPTDVEHPGFKLYPDVLLVARDYPDAIYDIRVLKDELRLPVGKYDELLSKLVMKKTVLVGRANEDDFTKNGGFIRAIGSMEIQGNEVVLKTQNMRPSDIVNGHLPFETAKYYKPVTRAGTANNGVSPKSKGLGLQGGGGGGINLFDISTDITLPNVSLDKTSYTIPEANRTTTEPDKGKFSISGSMTASVHAEARMDVAMYGGVDFGWNSNGGVCWDPPFFDKVCTGAPQLKGSAALITEYDFSLLPSASFTGSISKSFDIASIDITIGCEIPPGIPCFMKGGVSSKATIEVNGSVGLIADQPFRLSGTPKLGGEFDNFDVHMYEPSGPNFGAPTRMIPSAPGATSPDFVNISQPFTMSTGAGVSVGFGPEVTFGIGEPDDLNLHVTVSLQYKIGAFADVCYPIGKNGVVPGQSIGYGGSLKRGPELSISLGADAGPFHPSTSITPYSGYNTFASYGTPGCGGVPPDSGAVTDH